jgi:Cu-Zn family superoxide dismutase
MLLPLFFLIGCAEENPTKINVDMINQEGDSIGTVQLQEQASGVKLSFDLHDLPSGEHALYIHDKGSCKTPDFKSSGEHFNPESKKHGLLHPKGAHAGDLPNLIVEGDGLVKTEIMAPNISMLVGKNSLFTKEGTSIVIHEEKDDGMSQSSGASGAGIACGKIKKDE